MKPIRFVSLLLLIVFLIGCSVTPTPSPIATPAGEATRTPLPTAASRGGVSILADGQLVAVNPVLPVSFRASGELLSFDVQVGDWISAGDLIGELEITGLEDQLAQSRFALESAEQALATAEQQNADALFEAQIALEQTQLRGQQAEAQNVSTPVTVAYIRLTQAQQAVVDTQTAYDQAWDQARDWELYMTEPQGSELFPAPSMNEQLKAEREGTERGLAAAQDSLRIAQAEYNQAAAGVDAHEFDLQFLPFDLQMAEHRVQQLERGVDPSLALNVERAQMDIELLEKQLDDAQLYAPWDGYALSVETAPGALVAAGAPIITLFDPRTLEFHTTNLSERDLGQIEVGQSVQVALKTYPDEPVTGIVLRIAPQASGVVGDAAAFTVIIELELTELDLRPGMTGRVEIAAGD